MDIKDSHVFIVKGMDVCRVMFFRLVKHLDDDSVKVSDLGHGLVKLESAKIHKNRRRYDGC
jgi:hypothetical protein